MTAALVDSDILIDVATDDPDWAGWSSQTLVGVGAEMPLVINPIIWAEVSIAFERIEDLEQMLPATVFRREALPWDAGFLAGKAVNRRRNLRRRLTAPSAAW